MTNPEPTEPESGDTIRPAVGAQIKLIRTRLGLTQEDVAKRMGRYLGTPWHRQQVGIVESGQRALQIVDLMALAAVLDVPLTDILSPLLSCEVVFPTGERWDSRGTGGMELSWETMTAVESAMKDARSALSAGLSWLLEKANEQRRVPLPDISLDTLSDE